MDIVADAGSIRGWIVTAEDHKLLSLSCEDFLDEREQVVWVADWLVSQKSRLVSSARIEISQ